MYSSYRQDISASFFISGRYLHLKPLSADSDIGPIISCIPSVYQKQSPSLYHGSTILINKGMKMFSSEGLDQL